MSQLGRVLLRKLCQRARVNAVPNLTLEDTPATVAFIIWAVAAYFGNVWPGLTLGLRAYVVTIAALAALIKLDRDEGIASLAFMAWGASAVLVGIFPFWAFTIWGLVSLLVFGAMVTVGWWADEAEGLDRLNQKALARGGGLALRLAGVGAWGVLLVRIALMPAPTALAASKQAPWPAAAVMVATAWIVAVSPQPFFFRFVGLVGRHDTPRPPGHISVG